MAVGAPAAPLVVVVVAAGVVVVGDVVVGLVVVALVVGLVVVVVAVPPPLQAATSDNTTSNPTTRIHGASLFVTMLLSLLSILTYLFRMLIRAAKREAGSASLKFYTKALVLERLEVCISMQSIWQA